MFSNIGLPGILVIAALVLILFGRGKISEIMGDVGKGIKSFKKGVSEENENSAAPAPKQIDSQPTVNAETVSQNSRENG